MIEDADVPTVVADAVLKAASAPLTRSSDTLPADARAGCHCFAGYCLVA
jgi:hypothetical protein